MDKETFYHHLLQEDTDLKFLFENYQGEDYIELLKFVKIRATEEYAFPNDNPSNQAGKPFISKDKHRRLSIFALTLESSTTYNEKDLDEAFQFVDTLKS